MTTLTRTSLRLVALAFALAPATALAQQPEPGQPVPPAAPEPGAPPAPPPDQAVPPAATEAPVAPDTEAPAEPAPTPGEEPAPAKDVELKSVFPPPVNRAPPPKREKAQAVTIGMHPAAVDFGAEADVVSSVGRPKAPADNRRWTYALRGFLRAPMRIGIGPETGSDSGSQLHSPPRIVGFGSNEWNYIGVAPGAKGQLQLAVTNPRVEGHVIIAGETFVDAGYPHLDKQGGFSQAWVTLKSPALFGLTGGAALSVGAFSERFGMAGPYQQSSGYYGTYLFGRTHIAGYSLVFDLDLSEDVRLLIEQGAGAKVEVVPFRKANPPLLPYLPDQGPVPQGSNFVNHAHLSLILDDWFTISGHYLTSWSPNDLAEVTQEKAEEARMNIFGGEIHTDHPVAGHGYVGYSYIDAKRILPLSDGVQVIHGSTGYVFKENYFGALPDVGPIPEGLKQGLDPIGRDDSGKVQTLLFQYILRAAPLLKRRTPGPDVALSVFGMLNHVEAPKQELNGVVVPEFTFEQDKIKFGGELQFAPISLLSLGVRFDRVMPDGGNADVAYSALSPRVVLHSKWLGREYVILNYTRYFLGSQVTPSAPYSQPDPPEQPWPTINKADENLLSLTAMVAF
jgi:hypothetical protein